MKLWEGSVFRHTCLPPYDYYPWCIEPHCTSLATPAPPQTWDIGPPCPQFWHNPCYWHLVAITGNLFKLVHLRIQPFTPTGNDIWIHGHQSIWLVSKWDISCWNASLFWTVWFFALVLGIRKAWLRHQPDVSIDGHLILIMADLTLFSCPH